MIAIVVFRIAPLAGATAATSQAQIRWTLERFRFGTLGQYQTKRHSCKRLHPSRTYRALNWPKKAQEVPSDCSAVVQKR
jgi:hypothetical protein